MADGQGQSYQRQDVELEERREKAEWARSSGVFIFVIVCDGDIAAGIKALKSLRVGSVANEGLVYANSMPMVLAGYVETTTIE